MLSLLLVLVESCVATKHHAAAGSLPTGGVGERMQRVKMRKAKGSNEDCLLGKAKARCVSQCKQEINSPVPVGRQVFSPSQESRTPSHLMFTGTFLPFFFFSQLYMLTMMPYALEYPLSQLGSSVLDVSPPSSLCSHGFCAGRVG